MYTLYAVLCSTYQYCTAIYFHVNFVLVCFSLSDIKQGGNQLYDGCE